MGQKKVSILVKCPVSGVVMNADRVFGTAKCVLFMEVSKFQGVLIRDAVTVHDGIPYWGSGDLH